MVGRRVRAAIGGGVAVLLASTLPACAGTDGPRAVGPPPTGLVASLEDQADTGGAWRTTWVLCWDPAPSAVAYEIMTLSGEGPSPRLRRQQDTCLRVEAAAGDGAIEERPARRAAQLAIQQGQLAFQVRAVPARGPSSEWSAPASVGAEGPVDRQDPISR